MIHRTLLLLGVTLGFSTAAQTVTNIAYLRTLVDNVNYLPTDTTNLYTAEGVVTTHTNLTTAGNALFYMQDNTAGIAVFVGGSTNVRPRAGDRVRVTGPLGQFNGLLEFNMSAANSNHTVVPVSSDNPLPAAIPLQFDWQFDAVLAEQYEGSYLVASNVFLDLTSPTFPVGGGNVNITNEAGALFVLRVDARPDIGGQAKPTGPVTIFGVLGQFDSSNPRTEGYQFTPSRYADILSASKAPTVRFTNVLNLIRQGDLPTNTFTEHALLPGEKLTLQVDVTDPEGRMVTIATPTAGLLPANARWTLGQTTGTNLAATCEFEVVPANAGNKYVVRLDAWNSVATNNGAWTIYVPTTDEQKVTVSEFLANPATTNTAPHFNPLRRVDPAPSPFVHDEYVEIANLSSNSLDVVGWTVSDAVQVWHRFDDSFTLPASNSIVAYGGPLNGFAPTLDVPFIPSSFNPSISRFNDSGGDSIIVRNAASNLVSRVVYADRHVSGSGSSTRFPDLNGPFVPQVWVSTNHVSPGRHYDGRLFSEPPAPLVSISNILVSVTSSNAALNWTAEASRGYTVWQADDVAARFSPRFYGLRFTNAAGQFLDTTVSNIPTRFYWISSP